MIEEIISPQSHGYFVHKFKFLKEYGKTVFKFLNPEFLKHINELTIRFSSENSLTELEMALSAVKEINPNIKVKIHDSYKRK